MEIRDDSNTIFQLAFNLVNDTFQHVFLTGKAGTGKTTFLRLVMEQCKKNTIVVAPTGVAAINAGGVTMHSFFQLPRGMFIPGVLRREDLIGFAEATDKHSLFTNIHFSSNKREMLQELELLIIDEVSMVRCDMLDAIDLILRHFRKTPNIPFGGVQVLYIGDLFQLPPVVSNLEWDVLKEYYQTPFFFSARALENKQPLYIELKKIYRQKEQQFIEVLNRIRNNQPTQEDIRFINEKYNPQFQGQEQDQYITLTTHNKKADAINAACLAKLPGKLYHFKAAIVDDFSDKAFPTDEDLQLKIGSQVMFIKNDSSTERRYYNGKLGRVKNILDEEITVSFNDGSPDLKLEKETWRNIKYIYSKENDEIDEEVLGSFTQFPIRLAWAITVHKSQGLTFDKAIIDAGAAFAPGQVYVALSRCTSLDGIVLHSRIYPNSISTDRRILEFSKSEIEDLKMLEEIVEKEKYLLWELSLMKVFDWSKLLTAIHRWIQFLPEKKLPDVKATIDMGRGMLVKARELSEVARKFQKQLEQILGQVKNTGDLSLLEQRMSKAIEFFANGLCHNLIAPLQEHISAIQYAGRVKKYKQEVLELETMIWTQVQKLLQSRYGSLEFTVDNEYHGFDPALRNLKTSVNKDKKPGKGKKEEKGTSHRTSFELYKEGKSISEIAALRNMAESTIGGHLAVFVGTGELDPFEFVTEEKMRTMIDAIEKAGTDSAGLIKSRLGEEYSFFDIRIALSFHRLQKQSA